jgi:phage/plasmid-associated DNA primase
MKLVECVNEDAQLCRLFLAAELKGPNGAANELPRLADTSGALAGRFIVLVLVNSFYGREDHGLSDRLLTELPRILNWSIAGWRRLSERRHFVQLNSALDVVRQLEDLGSPIGAFIREECTRENRPCVKRFTHIRSPVRY